MQQEHEQLKRTSSKFCVIGVVGVQLCCWRRCFGWFRHQLQRCSWLFCTSQTNADNLRVCSEWVLCCQFYNYYSRSSRTEPVVTLYFWCCFCCTTDVLQLFRIVPVRNACAYVPFVLSYSDCTVVPYTHTTVMEMHFTSEFRILWTDNHISPSFPVA